MNQISIRAKHIVYILVVALLFLVWSFIYRFPLCRFAVYIDQSRTVATMYPGRKQWKTLGMDKLSDDNMQYIQRPHLMLFGRLYWSSPNSDGPVPTQDLICIGEVTESVEETPVRDFQGYFIDEGTKIYYDQRFPQILYLDSPSYMIRYATEEASRDYLYYGGTVYVSVASLRSWEYEGYQNDYVPFYGEEISQMPEIPQGAVCPEGAVYLGETKFIGYNKFVYDEFECNQYCLKPSPIYQDRDDPRILYLTDYSSSGVCDMIYVPLLGEPPS